jgi:murein DD-endopeptidase MepM/ murein hydrolase activator NlpD
MVLGWRGLAKSVALSAILTSAFWLGLGAWLYDRHLGGGSAAAVASPALPRPAAAPAASVAGTLIIPVAGIKPDELSDTFSQARADGTRRHDAIDIMAARGARVIAAAPGKVEKLFRSEAGGNTVYVRSPDGTRLFYYAHLDTYAPSLAEGRVLRQGDPIGTVGSTGNAAPDGPHLHFAIMATTPAQKWWNDAPALNPYPLLVPSRQGSGT